MKYKPSIPLQMFWSTDLKESKICPKCSSSLENEYQTYVMYARVENEVEQFIMGNKGGFFCPKCPVVVLDEDIFANMVSKALEAYGYKLPRVAIHVAGIVDIDAIPKHKRDQPLGTDDNPTPLVRFLESEKGRNNSGKDTGTKISGKIGRNQACPCGSGKKYKKCCG